MDDYDLEVAERRRNALLEGVSRPVTDDDPAWVDCAERLVSRGVGSYQQLADLLDIPFAQAQRLLSLVRERWRNSDSSELAQERREELYARVRAIGDVALASAMGLPDHSNQRAKYLTVALGATDRAAALAGVKEERKEVEVTIELRTRPAKEVLGEYGRIDLRALGAIAARAELPEAEGEVIEGELVAEPTTSE